MNFIEKVLELIYPTTCGICGNLNEDALCNKCKIQIKENSSCKIQKVENTNIKHMYLFEYKGILRDKMLLYKFKDKAYLYKFFAKIILDDKKAYDFLETYDIILPVPIHKKRRAERGYNQCELIAKELSKTTKQTQYNTHILIKTKNTVPQSSLNRIERIENAKDVYSLQNKEILENKKVLILDDIYTTGSTINECIKTVKTGNPKEIGVFTVAKD